jgi:hypothetical protein
MSLRTVLDEMPDPRGRHGRRHPLGAILALSVAAMLCGMRSLYSISQWGRDQGAPMARSLGFTRDRTPSVATLHRVFRDLDRVAFERRLARWMESQGLAVEGVAIDGKRLRGIHGEAVPGVHLVAAFAQERGVVLGQVGIGLEENELAALPELWEQVPLRGRVVTGDAGFTQRELCETIVEKGGTTSWSSRTTRRGSRRRSRPSGS